MFFCVKYSVGSRGEREWLLGVQEQEREWIIPFPKFGNRKGMEKTHSQNSGTGREWQKIFPKFGNGKGIKKIHSHNPGTGIRGFHSCKWTGMEIPAHPWYAAHRPLPSQKKKRNTCNGAVRLFLVWQLTWVYILVMSIDLRWAGSFPWTCKSK